MNRAMRTLVAASLVMASCTTPTPTKADKTASEPDNRPDLGQKFPGFCTKSVDKADDGAIDSYTRQILNKQGDPLVKLVDSNGDGVFDRSQVTVYGANHQRWRGQTDRHADGSFESSYPPITKPKDDRYWLLRPYLVGIQGGEPVLDNTGREIGQRKLRKTHDSASVKGKVSAYRFDANGRRRAEFVFAYEGDKANIPEVSKLLENVKLDKAAGLWRVTNAKLVRVHLLSYQGDTRNVIAEATWATSGASDIPTMKHTLDKVGLDEPHTLVVRKRANAQVMVVSEPQAWRETLNQLVVREVNAAGKMTRFRYYSRQQGHAKDDPPRLCANLLVDQEYDAQGHMVRQRFDKHGRDGRSGLDGVYDSVFLNTIKHGQVVEHRHAIASWPAGTDTERIPLDWRSVPLASATGETKPIAPSLTTDTRTTSLVGKSGNVLRSRRTKQLGITRYTYDQNGRLSRVWADGGIGDALSHPRLDGVADHIDEVTYDSNGRKIEKVVYVHNKKGEKVIQKKISFDYDEHGRMSKATTERLYPKKVQPIVSDEREYDDGHLAREVKAHWSRWSHGATKTTDTFAYDAKGRLIRRTRSSPRGKSPLITRYEYDDAGHVVRETQTRGKGKIVQRVEHSYDKDGKRSMSKYFKRSSYRDKTLRPWYVAKFSYDSDGRLISETQSKPPRVVTFGYDCFAKK